MKPQKVPEAKKVIVHDDRQQGYTYYITEPEGKNFAEEFTPDLTPQEMLELGVFGGYYLADCQNEFPKSWFAKAKLATDKRHAELNYFKVNASLSLAEWVKKGWIYYEDPRGWFQWYCRYYMGRRIPAEDARQIKRWKAIARHAGIIRKRCLPGDIMCLPKARQALLHWAYDSRKI